jgi:hypothetical protein
VVSGPLTGSFSIQPGQCALAGPPSGSYVELLEHGVPVPNLSSPCGLLASFYTPLRSGTEGLVSGAYELDPVPTFDGSGNSRADLVVDPVKFLGVGFGLATTCADQQHRATPSGACPAGQPGFPTPQLYAEPLGLGGCQPSLTNLTNLLDECLYGNLESLGATYNGPGGGTCASAAADSNGCYDIGVATDSALKATSCGSAPLGGCSLSGTYNPINSAYTLTLDSTIVGTPFNGATAELHLVGTYTPGLPSNLSSAGPGSAPTSSAPTAPPSGSNPPSPSVGSPPAPSSSAGRAMNGQFSIAAGICGNGPSPTGSWVQLGLGGSVIKNPNSSCDGGVYTLVDQGTEGLLTGQYQPNPTPTFDANGNSLAGAIIQPTEFLGTDFGAATDPQDEQTAPSGPDVFPAPQALLDGSTIEANLSALNFTYNGPANGTCASGGGDGCYALGSSDVTGTYDLSTRAYTLQFTGTIHGGAFNNATATFHLAGVFNGTLSSAPVTLEASGSPPPPASTGPTGGSGPTPGPAAAPTGTQAALGPQARELVGVFEIATGQCPASGTPTGSWVQLSKGGQPIPNPNSSCDGGDYTLVAQGTQGLETGQFQPNPTPTFDANGNSLAGAIIKPAAFLGTDFGAASNPQNVQSAPTGPAVFPAPYAVLSAGGQTFTANVSAINFTYNGPPGGTCASGGGVGCYSVGSPDAAGTYDPQTRAYTLGWTGQVVGGAFNGATATFHLTGVFNGTVIQVAAPTLPSPSATTPVPASVGGSSAPAGGTPAFEASPFPLAVERSLPGSGPLAPLEEVLSALVAVALLGVAAGPRLRRPRLRRPRLRRPRPGPAATG